MRLESESQQTETFALASVDRFFINDFAVTTELLGSKHSWQMENARVELRLPTREELEADVNSEDRRAYAFERLLGQSEPISFVVRQVELHVEKGAALTLPRQVMHVPLKAVQLLNMQQRDDLDEAAREHGEIAQRALGRWLAVVRWVSDDARIGRNVLIRAETNWSTYLYEKTSGYRLWSSTQPMIVNGPRAISREHWQLIQTRLSADSPIPVYIAQLHDAETLYRQRDYRRCTLDLCVSVETYVRERVWAGLPAGLSSPVRKHIEAANVNRVLTSFLPPLLSTAQRKQFEESIRGPLVQMFEDRNKIMHHGERERVEQARCWQYISAVRMLLAGGIEEDV